MTGKAQKFKCEVWKLFQKAGVKTKCKFGDTISSYKSNFTKSMWDHVKSKHAFKIYDEKVSVKEKFHSVMKRSKINFGDTLKLSKKTHGSCYRLSAEVCSFKGNICMFCLFQTMLPVRFNLFKYIFSN